MIPLGEKLSGAEESLKFDGERDDCKKTGFAAINTEEQEKPARHQPTHEPFVLPFTCE